MPSECQKKRSGKYTTHQGRAATDAENDTIQDPVQVMANPGWS